MTERRLAEVRDLPEAQRFFRARAEELGIPRDELDEIAGLPRGYSGKVLADPPLRNLGSISFWSMLGALGLAIVFVEDKPRLVKVENYRKRAKQHRRFATHWRNAKALALVLEHAVRGGKLRFAKMTKQELRLHQRNAAKARWRRWRHERKLRALEASRDQRLDQQESRLNRLETGRGP